MQIAAFNRRDVDAVSGASIPPTSELRGPGQRPGPGAPMPSKGIGRRSVKRGPCGLQRSMSSRADARGYGPTTGIAVVGDSPLAGSREGVAVMSIDVRQFDVYEFR